MGLGFCRERGKRLKKEWIDFSELEELKSDLDVSYVNIAEILGITTQSIKFWKKKGKCPAYAMSALRTGFAEHFIEEFQEKTKYLFKKHERED